MAIIPKRLLNRYNSLAASAAFIVILSIVISIFFRPLNFNDDYTYLGKIESFKYINYNDLGKISFVFYLQNKLLLYFIDNSALVLRLNFSLVWILFLISIFKEKVHSKIFILFYFICFFQVLFFIQLRNAFAIVFLFWGLIRFFKKRNYLLLFVLASLYHLSVLPFIITFYFFFSTGRLSLKERISNQKILLYLIVALVLSFMFYDIYYSFVVSNPLFQVYLSQYISSPQIGNTSIAQIAVLILHFLLFRFTYNKIVISPQLFKYEGFIYLGLLISIIVFTFPLFQRIVLPFYLFTMCVYYFYIRNDVRSRKNIFYQLLYLLLHVTYLAIAINRNNYFESWSII